MAHQLQPHFEQRMLLLSVLLMILSWISGQTQAVSRRAALGLLAGAAALVTRTASSEAAFGDAANVFGRTTNKSGIAFAWTT